MKHNKLIIIYGEPGVGKTTFAINDTIYKSLYISCFNDSGLDGISDVKGNIDVIKLNENDTSTPLSSQLVKICRQLMEDTNDYQNIVIDPFNFVQFDAEKRINGGKILQIQHYGEIINIMKNTIGEINKLKDKYNIILIMHQDIKDIMANGVVKDTKILPNLLMKVHTYLHSISNECVYMSKKKGKIIYDLGLDENAAGKTRNRELRGQHLDLTLDKIIGAIGETIKI